MDQRNLWPLTAMFGAGVAAITVMVVLAPVGAGSTVAAVTTAILAILSTVASAAYVTRHVLEVKSNVNGRMTELISKIPGGAAPPPADTGETTDGNVRSNSPVPDRATG